MRAEMSEVCASLVPSPITAPNERSPMPDQPRHPEHPEVYEKKTARWRQEWRSSSWIPGQSRDEAQTRYGAGFR